MSGGSTEIELALVEHSGRRRPSVWSTVAIITSLCFLLLVITAALVPSLLAPGDPLAADVSSAFAPPTWSHPFGFDELGRDVYTRVVHGTAPSVRIALLGVLAAGTLGIVTAAIGVFAGRAADVVVLRLLDVGMAIPGVLLALVIVAVIGRGEAGVIIAIAIVEFPLFARLTRSRLIVVRSSGYVETARSLGSSPWKTLVNHTLPNSLTPVLITAGLGIGGALIFASGLSFLGLGIQPPAPEWGSMLAAARASVAIAWWTGFYPGLVITLTVVAINVAARRLRGSLS